jgi:hypothetical protein
MKHSFMCQTIWLLLVAVNAVWGLKSSRRNLPETGKGMRSSKPRGKAGMMVCAKAESQLSYLFERNKFHTHELSRFALLRIYLFNPLFPRLSVLNRPRRAR